MRKLFTLAIVITSLCSQAQVAGDTLVVQGFDYTQTTYGQGDRKMMVNFPNMVGVSFEKILMLYNMRCKGGVVGNQVPPGGTAGCGEWDYSCNTYITDSLQTDSVKATHPSHIIPGFNGSSFGYSSLPTYTYYQDTLTTVTNTATITESAHTVGTGSSTTSEPFHAQQMQHKAQFLWTASELQASGLLAGNISSIRLQITSAGSAAQFLKIRMKHSTQSALSASYPDLNGFTEVYFAHTNFVNGLQDFTFNTPFVWNGSDGILVEFSYSNNQSGVSTAVLSDVTATISGLLSGDNDYHFDFNSANIFKLNNTNWSALSNQISIGFWCKGNADILPANTSIFHGHTNNGSRQLNVHLPWSNSRVYWDCGNGSGYDRIDKFDSTSAFENGWNYWTFTKNATTGNMKTFLNGNLWHSGTNKTMSILLDNLVLGGAYNNEVPYFGKMDEFSLWSTELSQTEIQDWMRKDITSSHPQFASLLANYKFNEGSGTTCNDAATTAVSAVNSPIWHLTKGRDILKGFQETSNRPTVTFVQGTYTQTTTQTVALDSVMNNPYTVYSFSTNGTSISPVDTQQLYLAGYTYVYDADSGTKIDSVLNITSNTISITNLNYFQFRPARFQIMSFVTPYGNGLNLGPTGKTWTFDVTDFAPILKGSKLMTMDAGGQWQEDMDVKFLFIVGTPPHDVQQISNLWRVDAPSYGGIMNNNFYEPRSVFLPSTASSFKIRSAITGHGQEGEFIPQLHWVNLNGGSPEFQWNVWKRCGENPVYPQGGTWIYDRAGWCPGMATDTRELNIDNYVTPGSTVTIDYGIDTAAGDSRYWVSNQLVSYGAPNFTQDAAVVDVMNPSLKVEYARTNSICANPRVVIQNTGSTPLTSATIEYWVNNNTVRQTYQWSGNLKFMEKEEVQIPSSDDLWKSLDTANNIFHAEIKNPNGGADGYSFNNVFHSPFKIPEVFPASFYISCKTNSFASETFYEVKDQWGNMIFQRTNMNNNTTYADTLHLAPGCYTIKVTDTDGDGISFWANNDGSGWFRLRRVAGGAIFKTVNPDFGSSSIIQFTVDHPLSFESLYEQERLVAYPNPTNGLVHITLPESMAAKNTMLYIKDMMGRAVRTVSPGFKTGVDLNLSDLQKGMYLLSAGNQTIKLVLE